MHAKRRRALPVARASVARLDFVDVGTVMGWAVAGQGDRAGLLL